MPGGEQDYLDALRAYTDTLYGRMLSTSESSYFLDKTPANALVLPFLQRLYPDAKYVVLTRHPLAVFSSYANSFFNGDWQAAHAFNPILERYVPAMATFLRERPVPLLHVAYEDLVTEPEPQLERIFAFLGLENDPDAVEYGKAGPAKKGMGDPITVHTQDRPVTDNVGKWAAELAHDADKRALAEQMIGQVDSGRPRSLAMAHRRTLGSYRSRRRRAAPQARPQQLHAPASRHARAEEGHSQSRPRQDREAREVLLRRPAQGVGRRAWR